MNLLKNKRQKQAIKTSDKISTTKTGKNQTLIREYLRTNGPSKASDISKVIGLSSPRTRAILKEMEDVISEGTNKYREYHLIEK